MACMRPHFSASYGMNLLTPSGRYMYHLFSTIGKHAFCIYVSFMILIVNREYFLKQR
jgi:hypothetical protein